MNQPTRPDEPIVAPGYQAALLPGLPARRARWRAVRRNGSRLPPVGELGVVIAQARAIALAEGAAWIVAADEHTIEIRRAGDGLIVIGDGARWVRIVRDAIARSTLRGQAAARGQASS